MCLFSKKTFASVAEAKEYIKKLPVTKRKKVVWKALEPASYGSSRTTLKSPYNSFIYEKGNHYYQTGQKFTFSVSSHNDRFVIIVNRGLHACVSPAYAHKHGSHAIQMVIPKGSTIILGRNGDIVTDNLIWE